MRPGLPTWLLGLLVVAALGGSAWLFWSDWSATDTAGTKPNDPKPSATTGVDESNDELVLPDDADDSDAEPDERRERLDAEPDQDGSDDDDGSTSDASAGELPAAAASLRDRRIALTPASALGTGDVRRLVTAAGLRVPCASPAADRTAIRLELAVATSTASLLERADARVVGDAATGYGSATCVDARVASFDDADAALVLRVDPAATSARVVAGRATGPADRATTALAAELAAALDLKSVTPARDAKLRTLLANAGAIDAPGGASVVLVELPTRAVTDEDARVATVESLVAAAAAWSARADAGDAAS